MKFRPCIDLHRGLVKQIVGSTLEDNNLKAIKTNYIAPRSSSWFARLYRLDGLVGGHIIRLGPGNDAAAEEALCAWPGGMQLGGGVNANNAGELLDKGASHLIVTSYVFRGGQVDMSRLKKLVKAVGKNRLVLDLSCRRQNDAYIIVTDRWQKFTEVVISPAVLEGLSKFCDEFLVHAVDVEGRCEGIETQLVEQLTNWAPIKTTYAGGIHNLQDLQFIRDIGQGRLDVTIGSALDIFGGDMSYEEVVAFCRLNDDRTGP